MTSFRNYLIEADEDQLKQNKNTLNTKAAVQSAVNYINNSVKSGNANVPRNIISKLFDSDGKLIGSISNRDKDQANMALAAYIIANKVKHHSDAKSDYAKAANKIYNQYGFNVINPETLFTAIYDGTGKEELNIYKNLETAPTVDLK